MIRTIITPKNQQVLLTIPEKYVGKQLEVIVFSQEEDNLIKNESKGPYFSNILVDTKGFKFNRDEANER